jgi:hypothetical protein
MTAHSLTHAEAAGSPVRRKFRNGSLQLGSVHFWLLISTLGGILGLVGFVFVLSSK